MYEDAIAGGLLGFPWQDIILLLCVGSCCPDAVGSRATSAISDSINTYLSEVHEHSYQGRSLTSRVSIGSMVLQQTKPTIGCRRDEDGRGRAGKDISNDVDSSDGLGSPAPQYDGRCKYCGGGSRRL